jgi:hypothetical protein
VIDVPSLQNLFGFQPAVEAAIMTAATKFAKGYNAKNQKHRKHHAEKSDREKERNIRISMHANHLLYHQNPAQQLISTAGIAG